MELINFYSIFILILIVNISLHFIFYIITKSNPGKEGLWIFMALLFNSLSIIFFVVYYRVNFNIEIIDAITIAYLITTMLLFMFHLFADLDFSNLWRMGKEGSLIITIFLNIIFYLVWYWWFWIRI